MFGVMTESYPGPRNGIQEFFLSLNSSQVSPQQRGDLNTGKSRVSLSGSDPSSSNGTQDSPRTLEKCRSSSATTSTSSDHRATMILGDMRI
jgi:hypothetical protein